MIQPINAFSPRAGFRGKNGTYGKQTSRGTTASNIALINAGGVAVAAGGLTTAIARSYTPNWAYAAVIGLCGSFLSLFFMTPQLIEKASHESKVKKTPGDNFIKQDTAKTAESVKTHLKPAKKLVQFRQS